MVNTQAIYFRTRAEHSRSIAQTFTRDEMRRVLYQMAAEYDEMASNIERREAEEHRKTRQPN
jgi:hypothetical protein